MSGGDIGPDAFDRGVRCGMRTPFAAFAGAGAKCFGDDLLDGPGASAAFGATAEAAIDLLGRARHFIGGGHGGADVVIGQYVAGTDDHENWQNPYFRCRYRY